MPAYWRALLAVKGEYFQVQVGSPTLRAGGASSWSWGSAPMDSQWLTHMSRRFPTVSVPGFVRPDSTPGEISVFEPLTLGTVVQE
jgi:hypothetical protein